jgi:hypothetical protein
MSELPHNPDPSESRDLRDAAPGDDALDLYADEQLHGEQRTAFESRLGREAALGEAYARQRAIDASLRRVFPPPAIDGHADRVLERAMAQLPPAERVAQHNGHAKSDPALDRAAATYVLPNSPASTSTDKRRRRQPLLRGWLSIAAMITLLIGVPSALWLWRDTIRPPASPYAPTQAMALDDLYHQQVARGFKPDWVCKDQKEFASYFAGRLGQALMIHDAPAGAAMLGLSYTGGVTPSSMGMLGTADGKQVLIVVDQAANDSKVQMNRPGDLKLYRRQIGSLMLYEITPLDQPKLLDMFYQPESPTSAQASIGCK